MTESEIVRELEEAHSKLLALLGSDTETGQPGCEPKTGFCKECDRLLNSPAVIQVCGDGDWEDWGDPESINGISNY